MSRTWRALAVVACAAVLGGACNKGKAPGAGKDEVVARVAGRPITKSYYEQRLEKMDRRFLPDTLDMAGRRKFLDFIVNKEVMAIKAEELKFGEDPRVVNNMKMYEDNLAANAAIDQLTKGKLDVTDADIEAFQQKRGQKVLVKHVLVKTRKEAEDIRKQIEAGADFDSMVAKYSTVPRNDANTGEPLPLMQRAVFGEVQYGEAMMPVEDAVFSTPIESVSQPVETSYGWHLFKPISKTDVTLPPLDPEARRRISTQIQLRRKRNITDAYFDSIAKQHRFKIEDDAVVLIYDKLPADVSPDERPDPKTEVKPVIPFTQAERDQILFEMDGKKYSVGDFSDRYDATSWFERPKRVTGAMGVRLWVRDRWMKEAQLARARKDGVYDLPEVANEVKLRREQMMVSLLHENLVGSQAPEPSEAQLQEFFDKHRDVYVDREKRAVNLIFNAQERVIRRALDEIQGGKDFVEVAVRYNEGATKAEDVQTDLFSKDTPQFAEIAGPTFAMAKVGDRTEPIKTKDFWVLLQLAAIVPERPFQLDEIRDNVKQDWTNQWSEDKLNELLAEWKKGVSIDVDEDVLGRAAVNRDDVYVPGRPAAETGKAAAGG